MHARVATLCMIHCTPAPMYICIHRSYRGAYLCFPRSERRVSLDGYTERQGKRSDTRCPSSKRVWGGAGLTVKRIHEHHEVSVLIYDDEVIVLLRADPTDNFSIYKRLHHSRQDTTDTSRQVFACTDVGVSGDTHSHVLWRCSLKHTRYLARSCGPCIFIRCC